MIKISNMKYLTALFILFTSLFANGQSDSKAKSILDQVSSKTKSYASITADFQFIMENTEVDLMEANEGSLIVQDDHFKLNISGIELISDGTTQWTYMPDAGEVNVSDAQTGEDEMINPATIFTIYERGFTNTYLGEFTNNAVNSYKIEMVPTEINEFERVILEINQNNYQIMGAVMFGTDGNKYTVNVKNMETTKTYPASTFKFDTAAHPDVDVIDMR